MTSNRFLLLVSVVITLSFPVLMSFFNYDTNWNWSTLTYMNLWSFDGMLRHIFFNGFHPVFPWAAFLIFGMWLGRVDLSKTAIRNRVLIWSVITLITTEIVFLLSSVLYWGWIRDWRFARRCYGHLFYFYNTSFSSIYYFFGQLCLYSARWLFIFFR